MIQLCNSANYCRYVEAGLWPSSTIELELHTVNSSDMTNSNHEELQVCRMSALLPTKCLEDLSEIHHFCLLLLKKQLSKISFMSRRMILDVLESCITFPARHSTYHTA